MRNTNVARELALDGDTRELLGDLLDVVSDVVGLASDLDESHLQKGQVE